MRKILYNLLITANLLFVSLIGCISAPAIDNTATPTYNIKNDFNYNCNNSPLCKEAHDKYIEIKKTLEKQREEAEKVSTGNIPVLPVIQGVMMADSYIKELIKKTKTYNDEFYDTLLYIWSSAIKYDNMQMISTNIYDNKTFDDTQIREVKKQINRRLNIFYKYLKHQDYCKKDSPITYCISKENLNQIRFGLKVFDQ